MLCCTLSFYISFVYLPLVIIGPYSVGVSGGHVVSTEVITDRQLSIRQVLEEGSEDLLYRCERMYDKDD